jgi:hypothetical protein
LKGGVYAEAINLFRDLPFPLSHLVDGAFQKGEFGQKRGQPQVMAVAFKDGREGVWLRVVLPEGEYAFPGRGIHVVPAAWKDCFNLFFVGWARPGSIVPILGRR